MIPEPTASAHVRRAAQSLGKATRIVTSPAATGGWATSADLDRTLADVMQLSSRLSGLLDEAGAWLERAERDGLLRDDRGLASGQTLTGAVGALSRAVDDCRALTGDVDDARRHTTHLAALTSGPEVTR